jgi:hypothetical protein
MLREFSLYDASPMLNAHEDSSLWQGFVDATLPRDAWTHSAHVRVAWMHRRRWALDEAHVLMRVGIVKLNASHGLVESARRGYHETITRAWLVVVGAAMSRTPEVNDSRTFLEMHEGTLGKDALFRYYSRGRLLGVTARARFLEPDLAPLPTSE